MTRPIARFAAFHRWVAGACAGVIWLLGVLALSPELHVELHDDCCEPQHVCAITLFAAGAENPAVHDEAPLPPRPVTVHRLEPVHEAAPGAPIARRLPPPCGPPAA